MAELFDMLACNFPVIRCAHPHCPGRQPLRILTGDPIAMTTQLGPEPYPLVAAFIRDSVAPDPTNGWNAALARESGYVFRLAPPPPQKKNKK
jgi:hypothetical protein